MARLFGTDGIRGVANRELTPDLALAVGRAAGLILAPDGGTVVVGRDTRVSGPMLEGALVAGLCSAGASVGLAGIIPTPAVAWLTRHTGAAAGAVISASHNPVPDNGLKFFSPEGAKVSDDEEAAIEKVVTEAAADLPDGSQVGTAAVLDEAASLYVRHLVATTRASLQGLKIVLDCAFGATWQVAPRAFEEAGAEVIPLHAEPDGARINVDCGSTNLAPLRAAVVQSGADLGLAFDGDGDRVLAVDETGSEVDGDRIVALCAIRLHESGLLRNNVVVSTVMANLGFRRALEALGIEVVATQVGDRHVAQAMIQHGAVLGGEQSGHVIFGEHSATGDGVFTALRVAEAVAEAGPPLSRLAHVFEAWPQVLINVRVRDRRGLESSEEVWSAVRAAERSLHEDGRVLLRPSGTEPVVRVMVEAADPNKADQVARSLAEVVDRVLA